MSETKFDNIVIEIYDKIFSSLKDKKLTINEITEITITVMELVELYIELSGEQKKLAALGVINKLMDVFNLPDKEVILKLVDKFIDAIVLASKKKIKINVKKWFKKLKCCK